MNNNLSLFDLGIIEEGAVEVKDNHEKHDVIITTEPTTESESTEEVDNYVEVTTTVDEASNSEEKTLSEQEASADSDKPTAVKGKTKAVKKGQKANTIAKSIKPAAPPVCENKRNLEEYEGEIIIKAYGRELFKVTGPIKEADLLGSILERVRTEFDYTEFEKNRTEYLFMKDTGIVCLNVKFNKKG